ncbi:MAG TPA: GMC family oxidoreductase N-terminal domain-containing protein [Methylomirabilota bacterium]|nr:GMC family oxidoreductase N-terminal domain-containing protein [Methylomirabilota bacterium]
MVDYIVVGGGSAGCVIATRLTEDEDVSVLLLEAGPRDTNPYIHMPVGFFKMTSGPLLWGYRTAPQKHCFDREMMFAQAKVLGGGGSINAEVFTRGVPTDYDRWARDEGCDGWEFAQVQPYFLRSEGNDIFTRPWHGREGPLAVSQIPDPHPMTKRFVQAAQEAGLPYNPDFNGATQEGCGVYQTTTRFARRCSAAAGYLKPALGRTNLTLETGVTTSRIVIQNGRATGVEVVRGGRREVLRADRGVVLSAGAIGSPKLLMLSGVGPADHLKAHGLTVAVDQPSVGANLQDHFDIDIVHELKGPWSFDKYQKRHWMLWAGLQYLLFKSGPAASNIVEGGAFWYADKSAPHPDTQFHFLAGAGVEAGIPPVASGNGVTLNSYLLRPRSRGSVRLASAEVADAPLIDPNYLDDPYDLAMSVEGVRIMREIMSQPAFGKVLVGEHFPGPGCRTQSELETYVRRHGRTAYHPVGTCRMGGDADAVVDPLLRHRAIEGLMIADASVMPSLMSSNTNAAAVMIAERAADFLKAGALAGRSGAPANLAVA